MAGLSIGDLAARSGVPVTTLRYYDRIGLLPATRSAADRRVYRPEDVETLGFIGLCQLVGCTLDEIRSLLTGGADRRAVARRKRAEVDVQLTQLLAVRAVLDHLAACRHATGSAACAAEVRLRLARVTMDSTDIHAGAS